MALDKKMNTTPDSKKWPAAPLPVEALTNLSVLLIDDEPSIRQFMVTVLERQGALVFSAASGEEGIYMGHAHRPDIILLDYHLPQLTGKEVIDRLREDPVTKATPIVLITGSRIDDDEIVAVQPAIEGTLLKPFQAEELIASVLRHTVR